MNYPRYSDNDSGRSDRVVVIEFDILNDSGSDDVMSDLLDALCATVSQYYGTVGNASISNVIVQ